VSGAVVRMCSGGWMDEPVILACGTVQFLILRGLTT
jgi:hypothetical protein